jgi:hypothetical protein
MDGSSQAVPLNTAIMAHRDAGEGAVHSIKTGPLELLQHDGSAPGAEVAGMSQTRSPISLLPGPSRLILVSLKFLDRYSNPFLWQEFWTLRTRLGKRVHIQVMILSGKRLKLRQQ